MSRRTRSECVGRLYQIEVLDFSNNGHHNSMPISGKPFKEEDCKWDVPHRTIVQRSIRQNRAKKRASGYGSILSCRKVETDTYLKNIEYLNLNQQPLIPLEPQANIMIDGNLQITVVREKMPQIMLDNSNQSVVL